MKLPLRLPTRLGLLLWFLLVQGSLFAGTGTVPDAGRASRPNILWLVTEDNSASLVGGYGNPLARTPVFDRLAREGILFERAYSTSAVCAPTRASLITGVYAPSLGTQHMRSRVPMPPGLRYFPSYLRNAGYFTSNRSKTDYNAEVLPGTWDRNGAQAHWRQRQPGQPFFSIFNFTASHESSLHRRLPLKTDPAKVRVPAYLPDTAEVRADLAQYLDQVTEADRQIGEVLAELEADGLLEDTVIFYYSDHGGVLPRSKRFLYENGTHVPLVIRFPKRFQHLAPDAPGSRNRELVNWVDLAPTVLSLADVQVPPHFQGRALAGSQRGVAPEYTFQFRDRMDERYDLSRAVTDGRWRYIRHYRPELPTMQHVEYLWRMASMQDWARLHGEGKLNAVQSAGFGPKASEELFDCDSDPDNVRNLAAEPVNRPVLERMRMELRLHLLRTRDTGFLPEPMLRAMSGEHSPREALRESGVYPLERILPMLDRLQTGDDVTVEQWRGWLSDGHPAIRYWAVMNAERVRGARVTDLEGVLAGGMDSVRLAAAWGCLRLGQPWTGWSVLEEGLAAELSSELRLEALNHLTMSVPIPVTMRPVVERVAAGGVKEGEDYPARAAQHLLGQKWRAGR